VVREQQLGLTHARLRGISESSGETLVFVDDDNVLDPDYLERAKIIGDEWALIGAWGGQLVAEFEVEPQASVRPYINMVGIRQLQDDKWSNIRECSPTVPYGAGLCVRRRVAVAWATQLTNGSPLRLALDPTGGGLLRCGDLDLALKAPDIGLGTGLFTALRLTHLIPARRVELKYLLELQNANGYSHEVLSRIRSSQRAEPRWRFAGRLLLMLLQRKRLQRRFRFANERGRRRARADIDRVLSAG
jgi:glycosyltransferase involved in cell wall biosynthesis